MDGKDHATGLRRLSDVNAPFLPLASGNRQNALPFTDLINGPGMGLIFIVGVWIRPRCAHIGGLSESFVQRVVEKAFRRKAFSSQGDVSQEREDFLRCCKRNRIHRKMTDLRTALIKILSMRLVKRQAYR